MRACTIYIYICIYIYVYIYICYIYIRTYIHTYMGSWLTLRDRPKGIADGYPHLERCPGALVASGFRVQSLGFRGLGFRVLGFRGLGFRVEARKLEPINPCLNTPLIKQSSEPKRSRLPGQSLRGGAQHPRIESKRI